MFKKQTVKKKPVSVVWEQIKYKTPNIFEGMIFKGFVTTRVQDEKISGHINYIRLYRNDIHTVSFIDADDIRKDSIEITENTICAISSVSIPEKSEVWVVVTSGGIVGLIWQDKNKVPHILTNTSKENNVYIANTKLAVRHIKSIRPIELNKLIRVTARERESLLVKMKTILFKDKIQELSKNGELNLKCILSNLPQEYHLVLSESKYPNFFRLIMDPDTDDLYLVENGDIDNKSLVENITLLPNSLTEFEISINKHNKIDVLNFKLATVKLLNNKECLSILSKGTSDVFGK